MQLTLPSDLRCIIFLSCIFSLKISYVFILIFALWKDNSLSLSLKDQSNYDPWSVFFSKVASNDATRWCRIVNVDDPDAWMQILVKLDHFFGGNRGRGGGGQLFIRGHVNSNNWRILITRFSNGARGRLAFISDEISLGRSGPKPPFPSC